MKPEAGIVERDWRRELDEQGCKENHGCNVAAMCMCSFAEDLIEENERLRSLTERQSRALVEAREALLAAKGHISRTRDQYIGMRVVDEALTEHGDMIAKLNDAHATITAALTEKDGE